MNKLFLFLVLLAIPCLGATPHGVDLSWVASPDAAGLTGLTYNVYRASGGCPATGLPAGPVKIASALTGTTYSDSNVTVASIYCYYVTAQFNNVESAPSNTKESNPVPLASPTGVTAVAH